MLTLTAVTGTLCLLALFVMELLTQWPAVARPLGYPVAIALLLISGGVSAALSHRLATTRRAQRNPPTPANAPQDSVAPAGNVSRRDFLKFVAAETAVGSVAVAALGYIGRIEPRWLQVEEIEVPITGLPSRLDGLRIVQLSDLHLSSVVPLEHIQRSVAIAQDLAGDLIAVTGDYVSNKGDDVRACAGALSGLRAPLGVYAILGNRDYAAGAAHVADELTTAGLSVLRNQGQAIALDGAGHADFWLAGLDDVRYRQDDLAAALGEAPGGLPVILLVHEPDYALRIVDHAADLGIVLQLSGHTHGGQVRLPFFGAPVLPYLGRQFPQGLQKAGQMWVYTNRGVGMVSPPIRFNCPPEITALTLRRA